jgi:hypothetical protein
MAPTGPPGSDRHLPSWRGAAAIGLVAATAALSGCALVAGPGPATVKDGSLARSGPLGYVVCPNQVTPVELSTRTPEAPIELPVSGTPVLGNFAITTSADGRWAYVVTEDGVVASSSTSPTVPTGAAPTSVGAGPSTGGIPATAPAGVGVQNVVVPIDLVTQQAEAPIKIPGQGGTHAVVVLPGGRTLLAASGSTIVPVDPATRRVGAPLDLGPGRTIFGMALAPDGSTLYALVAGGVFPVALAHDTAGVEIPTGLSVSSVDSPHGIVTSADGATVYVVGQGGDDFEGSVVPIDASLGSTGPAASFTGVADPAALTMAPDGSGLLVVDSANNWVNPLPLATFTEPPAPDRLPAVDTGPSVSGTQHPTDIVAGPRPLGAFVVYGFSTVIPYAPGSHSFGRPIPVCSGASSMAIAPAP